MNYLLKSITVLGFSASDMKLGEWSCYPKDLQKIKKKSKF